MIPSAMTSDIAPLMDLRIRGLSSCFTAANGTKSVKGNGSLATRGASTLLPQPFAGCVNNLSVERLLRCVLAVGMAALFIVTACEAAPAERATVAIPSPTPTPSPTDPPRRAPTPTPPNGPDALVCAERVTLPPIADVIGIAWSPNGRTLAIDHTVVLPSARITGSPEDFFLDALDLPTGELTPLGVGERQQWSTTGNYLRYWSWDGE